MPKNMKICKVNTCEKKHFAKRFCVKHYRQVTRHGKISVREYYHGLGHTRFSKIWKMMKQRCLNDKIPTFKYYKGRGIKLCKRWIIFHHFYDDMFKSYQSHVNRFGEINTSIDRINNMKGYFPKNCRWATKKEQANNRRK